MPAFGDFPALRLESGSKMGKQAELEQFFYDFRPDQCVPANHLPRQIDVFARTFF
ncbi:MAG: hypothetical protein ACR2RF_32960 [Geminicoccaceae bacterium]